MRVIVVSALTTSPLTTATLCTLFARSSLQPASSLFPKNGFFQHTSTLASHTKASFSIGTRRQQRRFYTSRLAMVSTRSVEENTTNAAKKVRTALDENDKGEFKRQGSAFRNWISREDGAKFPPESGRYHLFTPYACPWAHRTLIVRALKGLDDVISATMVHPVWRKTRPNDSDDGHTGWVFGDPKGEPFKNTEGLGGPFPASYPKNEPDPINNSYSIRDLYDIANDTNGKYTVPILWDKKLNTIVSNESADIIRMFNTEFNGDGLAKNPDLDLYPEDLRSQIDAVNEWVYPTINNGVYRCGFATVQWAYDKAINELTESFDRIEKILEKQRYIAGDKLTEADVRLFVTLLRFDEVYIVYFKTNTRSVATSPAILNYCREIYQSPGVADTVDMDQIKAHYFCSHPKLNAYSIIPKGPNFIKLLEEPHNRDQVKS